MAKWIRDNALGLAAFGLFLVTMAGQSVAGHLEHNQEQQSHGGEPIGYVKYLTSGHFGEATFENWESEFLQMAMFIFLTAVLVQKGSAESRKPPGEEGAGEEPTEEPPELHRHDPEAPWPVRHGGLPLTIYKRSLGLTLLLLFLVSFAGHAVTGAADYNQEAREHGEAAVSIAQYMGTSRFWFESFQNWQSEFLAVFALAVLSIWLRQEGSPESKPVHAPHEQTGAE